MSWLDKVKGVLNQDETEFEDDSAEQTDADGQEPESKQESADDYSSHDIYSTAYTANEYTQEPKINSSSYMRGVNTSMNSDSKLQVILVKPTEFKEVKSIADYLNEKIQVVLNLEDVSGDVSQRIIDFLSGVAYANDGKFNRIANSTFIITPYNVDMQGTNLEDVDMNGFGI